ncbi:hypothetical protein [Oceaniglobus trochenteri]|uniref:hypothetical protein n=1 Tax=Oceaniglobus trochenteri TaxID=2763260 RepID=UPI001CFFF99F|nr:hypothetical protein [Oceaniglobus trochenteri]
MTDIDDAFLDAFEHDMAELSRRPYPEIGVATYLVAEDLTGERPALPPDPEGEALARDFAAIIEALERRNGTQTSADIARAIEVLADRTFLDVHFSSFSARPTT